MSIVDGTIFYILGLVMFGVSQGTIYGPVVAISIIGGGLAALGLVIMMISYLEGRT